MHRLISIPTISLLTPTSATERRLCSLTRIKGTPSFDLPTRLHKARRQSTVSFPTAYLEAKGSHDKVNERERDGGETICVGPLVEKDNKDGATVVEQHVQLRHAPRGGSRLCVHGSGSSTKTTLLPASPGIQHKGSRSKNEAVGQTCE